MAVCCAVKSSFDRVYADVSVCSWAVFRTWCCFLLNIAAPFCLVVCYKIHFTMIHSLL